MSYQNGEVFTTNDRDEAQAKEAEFLTRYKHVEYKFRPQEDPVYTVIGTTPWEHPESATAGKE